MCKWVAVAIMVYLAQVASGKTIFVDDNAVGASDGTSWTNAYRSLQSALRAARAGDQIWVAEGIYYPSSDGRRRTSFELVSGIELYGGFCGDEASVAERPQKLRETLLSGNIGDPSRRTDNSVHILESIGTDATTRFDGFHLMGAYNSLSGFEGRGGAIYAEDSRMAVANCVFRKNYAGGGGAIWFQDSNPVVQKCKFVHNKHRAVNNNNSHVALESCVFIRNSTFADGSASATYNGSTLLASNCAFIRNMAEGDGGAYFGRFESAFINCLFIGNSGRGHGGAIYQFDGPLIVAGCSFYENHSDLRGGGAISCIPNAWLENSVFWKNTAFWSGEDAQLEFGDNPPSIDHCLVEGWTGRWGGEGNFDADPKWIDAGGGNLRIAGDSPCVDAGTNDAVTEAVDLDGNPRILGGRVDIGAYENLCREVIDLAASMVEDDAEGHIGDGDGVCETGEDCVVTATVAVDAATMPEGSAVRVVFAPVDENGDPDPDACCADHTCGPDARCPKVRKARIDAAGGGMATLRGCAGGRWTVCVEGCGEALCQEVSCP